MARKSRLVQILTLAEDLLIHYHRYFEKRSWVYHGSGMPKVNVQKSAWYLMKKDILDKDLSFKSKHASIYREIRKPWNKKWQMIIYDIPEEKKMIRKNLRNLLEDLGFKCLQRSVWLSPFTSRWIVNKITNIIDDPKHIFTFKAEFSRKDSNYIVDDLWPVDDWKYKVRNFLNEVREKDKLTHGDQEKFWDLVAEHPKVPLDLLPRNWPLKKLAKTFIKFSI